MQGVKKTLGLTTDTATNWLALLLGVFEFGKQVIPASHAEAFTYVMVLASMGVLWLTRGHEAVLDTIEDDLKEAADDQH